MLSHSSWLVMHVFHVLFVSQITLVVPQTSLLNICYLMIKIKGKFSHLKLVCLPFDGNLSCFSISVRSPFYYKLWFLLFHTAKCSGTKLISEN